MRTSSFVRAFLVLASGSLLWASCGGAGFEPASKIKGLRVLALQKEPPYPHPGDTVALKLLYWDGKAADGASRNVEFKFFQCDNPPGDLYYACFSNPANLRGLSEAPAGDAGAGDAALEGSSESDAPPDAGISSSPDAPMDLEASVDDASSGSDAASATDAAGGDETTVDGGEAPPDEAHIVEKRIVIPETGIIVKRDPIDYGLRYIFFTACAGTTVLEPGGANDFPVKCKDGNQYLGPDDFVPGYSSLYVYDTDRVSNANPIVTPALEITSPDPGPDGVRHVPRCTESDRSNCPSYAIKAVVDQRSVEVDTLSNDGNGNPFREQLWVAYYVTDGDFTSSLRLVNDATTGWNDDYGTKFRAPSSPGIVHLFGVVHDNRGGVAWALGKVVVD
jgi:hypothetical protein